MRPPAWVTPCQVDGGCDFACERNCAELDEYYLNVENFLDHYADEIDGRCEPEVDDMPPVTLGAAYR